MTHRREVKLAAWLAAAVAIAAVAYFAGSMLKPDEAPFYVYQTDAPAYQQPAAFAATSQAGFTGFDELEDGNSRTVISGRVVDRTGSSLTIEAAGGQRVTLTLGASPGVSRLAEASPDAIQPGDKVELRFAEGSTDRVAGVLVEGQGAQ